MPMTANGLNKLMEECGELIQVCAKKAAYMHTDIHPDGSSLSNRMVEEMADVWAAIMFVEHKLGLNSARIDSRAAEKYETFTRWDADINS